MFNFREDIIDFVKNQGQVSTKGICELYYGCRYIPKRKTRKIVNSLIEDGILVKVDDVDCFGRRVDDVVISDLSNRTTP